MKRYTVLTYIFNGYEFVHEVGEKDPEADYVLVTDDPNITSETWRVVYSSTPGYSPFAKCYDERFHPFRYADTPIVVRVDGSIEIRQSLTQVQGSLNASIDFIPYRGNFARGIFCTAVVKTQAPAEDVIAAYKDFYKDAAFTHYSDKAIDLKQVVNTNKALVHVDCFEGKILITSAIDNLLKGAVGQAVQNMNLLFGIDETAGLKLKASAF